MATLSGQHWKLPKLWYFVPDVLQAEILATLQSFIAIALICHIKKYQRVKV